VVQRRVQQGTNQIFFFFFFFFTGYGDCHLTNKKL
jgi:hypothetical protein